MTPIEAVEYMKSTALPVKAEGYPYEYKLHQHDIIVGYKKDTSCAASIIGTWKIDDFMTEWYNLYYTPNNKVELLPV